MSGPAADRSDGWRGRGGSREDGPDAGREPVSGEEPGAARKGRRAAAVMPELRVRGAHWLSYSGEEAILILLDALGRGEAGLDQLSLELEGTHRGPLPDFSEEPGALSPDPGTRLRPGQPVQLRVRRGGLYEHFPAIIFTRPEDYANRGGTTEAPRHLELDEAQARLFCRPFDREAVFLRSRIRHWSGVFAGVRAEARYRDFIWRLFGLSLSCRRSIQENLDDRGQTILTFLIPHLHEIVGHRERTVQVLRMYVLDPLSLRDGAEVAYDLAPGHRAYLDGSARLGQRALGDLLVSAEKTVVLKVGPVPPDRMERYRSPEFVSGASGPLFELGAPQDRGSTTGWGVLALALRFMCHVLMPVDLRIMLQPQSASAGWKLEERGRGRCGIDTFAATVPERAV